MGLQHSWTGGEAAGHLRELSHVYGQNWQGSNGTRMSAVLCSSCHTRIATNSDRTKKKKKKGLTHLDEELSIFSV